MDEKIIRGDTEQNLLPQNALPEGTINGRSLQEITAIMQEYKKSKASVDRRIKSAENWWKLRNQSEEAKNGDSSMANAKSKTGWLHNVIVSKHADYMDSYPEPNILPREESDRVEAKSLTSIVPVVLERNHFQQTYSKAGWTKLKHGTAIYSVTWDTHKLGGLGDITVENENILNLFWTPGIDDIQNSRYIFKVRWESNSDLIAQWPQLKNELKGISFQPEKYAADDNLEHKNESVLVTVYFKKQEGENKLLHMAQFVGDTLLFNSEGMPEYKKGYYDDGDYPFVTDALFPIEESICGYGFVDLCQSPQTDIDALRRAMIINARAGAIPRWFYKADGAINEEEYLNLEKALVHYNGTMDDNSLKSVPHVALDSNYLNLMNNIIDELRETSGNTDAATGATPSGVTAASAIAALQEASGKGSRDSNTASYFAYEQIVLKVIERIRQFYDMPRSFRILGQNAQEEYIQYSNAQLQEQALLGVTGDYMRRPIFDIKVSAQKRVGFVKANQNELAVQLYGLGAFNPQMADQILPMLKMMEFDGKDALIQQVAQSGTMMQTMTDLIALAYELAGKTGDTALQQQLAQMMNPQQAPTEANPTANQTEQTQGSEPAEHPFVAKARASALDATRPTQ